MQPIRFGAKNKGYDYSDSPAPGESDRHTLGSIIWMALLRLVVTIFLAWYLRDKIANYGEWLAITMAAIYGIALYPAQIQYAHFKRISRRLIEQTLCSSCRNFDPQNLHCVMLDEHITENYLPCAGEGWEPKSFVDIPPQQHYE